MISATLSSQVVCGKHCIYMYLDENRTKKIGGYDQEIPQSQIAEKSMAFSEKKIGHKNTPPPKPYGSGFNVQYFPILTHFAYRANFKKV